MQIALSVDALTPQLTGIGRYCWELTERLPVHRDVDRVDFYVGHRRVRNTAELLGPRPSRRVKGSRLLSKFQKFRKMTERDQPRAADLVHGPNYLLPDWAHGGVLTVHDLSVFKYPEMHPADRVALFEREFHGSLARASHIITDTETIRREVMEYAALGDHCVTAVPLGVRPAFRPIREDERAPVLERYGLPTTGYGLSLSSLEPRKRLDRLLCAWRELPRTTRDRFPLVIAGAAGWNNLELHAKVEQGAAEGWLLPLGFVAEQDLPAIYAGAKVFAFPSIYEGFGLPPIEAMASGVPTIVAGASCLPEVTSGAAMIADPDDVDNFARCLLRGLEDETWRRQAVSAGIQVARGYTWTRCVDETVSVYQRVVSTCGGGA